MTLVYKIDLEQDLHVGGNQTHNFHNSSVTALPLSYHGSYNILSNHVW